MISRSRASKRSRTGSGMFVWSIVASGRRSPSVLMIRPGTPVTVQFEGTDLENFSKFLYNVETNSTKIRVLELKWDLLSEKDNPIQPGSQPGNRIGPPTAKFGFRRPIARR